MSMLFGKISVALLFVICVLQSIALSVGMNNALKVVLVIAFAAFGICCVLGIVEVCRGRKGKKKD